MTAPDSHDTETLKAALAASEARAAAAEAQIAALTLMIAKLRRALYGRRSERKERLLDQLELALDELTASATEDELAAEKAAAASTEIKGFIRRKPSRKPFPVNRLSILTPDRRPKLTPLRGTAEVVPVVHRGDPRGFV